MQPPSQDLIEPGPLKITIVEKHPDGTCRVHTYACANGLPVVSITSYHASPSGAVEDDDALLALSS